MEVPHRRVPPRLDDCHHSLAVRMHAQTMDGRHEDFPQGVGRKPLVAHGIVHGHELCLRGR
eukprot:3455910-Alexandrium_andersonii.AAC.1